MDSVQIARSPASSPAKGKGNNNKPKKPTGKGVSKRKGKKSGNAKGRGRTKTFDDPRVQAAHDRQKVLRDLYSEVANAIKPVLDDLASRSLKTLLESPTEHEDTPEFHLLQRQLDERLDEVIRAAEHEFSTRTAIATREYQLHTAVTEKKFHESYNLTAEEFYDASLKRAGILDQLQRDGGDVNLPDTTYNYAEKPDDVLGEQGLWIMYRDGVEVPYPSLLEGTRKAAVAKGSVNKGKSVAKRKAEDQPDGQPDPKKSAALSGTTKPDNGDEAATPQPRHTKGLLSAEAEPEGEPESNAPSPSPELGPKAGAPRGKKAPPGIPDGASEPDKWGVRIVARRGQKANNRLILEPPVTFGENEIGVRDSANKKTGGEFGDKVTNPNPRNFHVDRTIVTYDCLTYQEGDLDSDLIERHNLHPKYGLFLPISRNKSEPPKPFVSGANPIVVITPNGATLHASRSVRDYKMDVTLREHAIQNKCSFLLERFCEEADIDREEIQTEEIRERERQRQVAEESHVSSQDENEVDDNNNEGDDKLIVAKEHDALNVVAAEPLMQENVSRLLNAASQLDIDQPSYSTSNQRSSRPYDAVRDVFTNMEPTPSHAMPVEVDTYGLSFLADVSEQVSLHREAHFDSTMDRRLEPPVEYRPDFQMAHHANGQFEYGPEYIPDHRPCHHLGHRLSHAEVPSLGDSMIDPRLLGPPLPVPPAPNTFLQTALNPAPVLTPIAPAPPQGTEPPVQVPLGRNPFTSQGTGKGSPVLPPLRPSRREKGIETAHPPPQPLLQQSPDFGPSLGMIQSNSGNYFPPAPSRPYHQAYTLPEQGPIIGMPFMTPGGSVPSSQPPHHLVPSRRSSYQPSSPKMSNHAQMGVMPMHMPHGSPVSPPGSSMGLRSPTGPPGSCHRASFSSGSSGAGNGKYRRIAAAPIQNSRPWPGNGGAELRLAHYDHRESIKDYPANEPPPRTGPTTIRGWNVNNVSKGRKGLRKEDSEEKEPPR
ncbi:hypothetical protein GGS21DRAFT_544728 [Xylaria nigripes]|nr:hypothetical protein GGS21DRAFT_544728 [Xylaria nigripes]